MAQAPTTNAPETATTPAAAQSDAPTGEVARFTNVYVKNLPLDTTQEKLSELFEKFGTIMSAKLMCDEQGKSKGFGFVNFGNFEDAQKAVQGMNGLNIGGRVLFCGRALKKAEREQEIRQRNDNRGDGFQMGGPRPMMSGPPGPYRPQMGVRPPANNQVNLFVKNLDDNLNDDEVVDAFKEFGTITSAKVMRHESGASKGFGFVCYSTPDEARKAIENMSGRILGGKPVYVAYAQKKEERRQQLAMQHAQRAREQAHQAQFRAMQMGGAPPMQPPHFMGGPGGQPISPVFYGGPGQFPFPMHGGPQGGPHQRPPQGQGQGGAPGAGPAPGGEGNGEAAPQGENGNASAGGAGGKQAKRGNHPQQQQQQQQQMGGPRGPGGRMMGRPYMVHPGAPVPPGAMMGMMGPGGENGHPVPNAAPLLDAQGQINANGPFGFLLAQPPAAQKQFLGEQLYGHIATAQPELAGKITGMILELDVVEVVKVLSDPQLRSEKITEALEVLGVKKEEGESDAAAAPAKATAASN